MNKLWLWVKSLFSDKALMELAWKEAVEEQELNHNETTEPETEEIELSLPEE